jgi:FAD/FMN-containing dehydrogenase
VPALPPASTERLAAIVGRRHVLIGDDAVAGYATDWTGRFVGHAPAVVRPGSTDEVAAVVAWCATEGVAVVPQGGNTGLVGGGVPLHGEIVLATTRLGDIGPVDAADGRLTAGAGVTLAAVHEAARGAGWDYAIDFASRDGATFGGTIATNAGGTRVFRHGMTRAQLLGVEAVLGDGSVVSHLGGLPKDNTGFDLASLLCGSEGTLGIVTRAMVRLVPRADERVVALIGLADVAGAVAAVRALRAAVPALDAAEFFLDDGLALVCDAAAIPRPFDAAPAYLLVEAAAPCDPTGELAAAVESLPAVAAVAVAGPSDPARRAALWRYREGHTDAINRIGPPHKLDVTVPLDAIAELVTAVPVAVAAVAPAARSFFFGHAADGNVHVNVTGVDPADDRVDDAVLRLVVRLGGSISAEHGIGAAKRRWLPLARTAAEIDAFRRIKQALDPAGILNPHVLLP